jgi:hypothetical protein
MNSEERGYSSHPSSFNHVDVRTTLTRELWTSGDRSAQFQARVGVFSGNLVRIGLSRFWWCEAEKRFLPSQKGHCYFPIEALDSLAEVISELQAEARRLTLSLDTESGGKRNDRGTCTFAKRHKCA